MTRRLFELDGGPGDRYTVLLDGSEFWGLENTFTHIPNYARQHARVLLAQSVLRGSSKYDKYEITEVSHGGA